MGNYNIKLNKLTLSAQYRIKWGRTVKEFTLQTYARFDPNLRPPQQVISTITLALLKAYQLKRRSIIRVDASEIQLNMISDGLNI